MDNEKFGQFVRCVRKEKQMTQQQLAERLHLTDKAVSKWERGLSLPDISMLEQLARELDVSVVELLSGEKKEESIQKEDVEELLVDTMNGSLKKEKKVRKRYLILMGTVIFLAVLTVLYGQRLMNGMLDWYSKMYETPYHTCEFEITMSGRDKPEGCFIYKEAAGQFRNNYHVMEIVPDGTMRKLFTLEETGMDLDRAPRLIQEEECLYVLFDGMDNEDPTERIYQGTVGADPQGFLPRLFRYDYQSGRVEEIPLPEEKRSLLIDAFTWNGNPVTVTQQFKGLLFGLNLGMYRGDKLCVSGQETLYFDNLTKDGGIRSSGCAEGDSFYIAAPDGIRKLNLKEEGMELVKEMDLSLCGRAELRRVKMAESSAWAAVFSMAEAVDENRNPFEWKTRITVFDDSFMEMETLEIPGYASAVEWGKTSVMISDSGEEFASVLADFKTMTAKEVLRAEADEVKSDLPGFAWQQRDSYRRDALEECTSQWVYLESSGEYYLAGSEKRIKEE